MTVLEIERIKGFKPGIYKHYKGGVYVALKLVHHHHSREYYVLYYSREKCQFNVRPLVELKNDPDGWTTPVLVKGKLVDRFVYQGPATQEEIESLFL